MEEQNAFIGEDDYTLWKNEWKDMPEFVQKDIMPWKTIKVHFESKEDLDKFAKIIEQKITIETKYIWFPEATLERVANKRYVDGP